MIKYILLATFIASTALSAPMGSLGRNDSVYTEFEADIANAESSENQLTNGIVIWTTDGGYDDNYDTLRPIFLERGVRYSIGISVDNIGGENLTVAEMQTMIAEGFDFNGAHSLGTLGDDHPHCSEKDEAFLRPYFEEILTKLDALNLGVKHDWYFWPHGDSSVLSRRIASDYFRGARATTGSHSSQDGESINPETIETFNVRSRYAELWDEGETGDFVGAALVAECKRLIDRARDENAVLTFYSHWLEPAYTNMMIEVLDYAIANCEVMTYSDWLDSIPNRDSHHSLQTGSGGARVNGNFEILGEYERGVNPVSYFKFSDTNTILRGSPIDISGELSEYEYPSQHIPPQLTVSQTPGHFKGLNVNYGGSANRGVWLGQVSDNKEGYIAFDAFYSSADKWRATTNSFSVFGKNGDGETVLYQNAGTTAGTDYDPTWVFRCPTTGGLSVGDSDGLVAPQAIFSAVVENVGTVDEGVTIWNKSLTTGSGARLRFSNHPTIAAAGGSGMWIDVSTTASGNGFAEFKIGEGDGSPATVLIFDGDDNSIQMPNLPTSSAGLGVGSLWNSNGFIRVVN